MKKLNRLKNLCRSNKHYADQKNTKIKKALNEYERKTGKIISGCSFTEVTLCDTFST